MLMRRKPADSPPPETELAPITADPEYAAAAARLKAIDIRLAEAEAREKRARQRQQMTGDLSPRPHMLRALDLIEGGIIPATDPESEIEAARSEQRILLRARQVASDEFEEVKGRLSFEACKRFVDTNKAAIVAVYEALTEAWVALDRTHDLRTALSMAGYTIREDVLIPLRSQAMMILGRPDNQNGELYAIRAGMIRHGILDEGAQ